MKKIFALALAVLCLMTCLVGCAGQNDDPAVTTTAATTAATTVAEKPVLKMATNAYFQPYEFYKDGKIVGIDAEIAAAVADYLGYKLEIVDMEFDSIITAVKEGSVDFGMAGMTVTPDRLLEIDFSNSYATGVQSIIVPAGCTVYLAEMTLS